MVDLGLLVGLAQAGQAATELGYISEGLIVLKEGMKGADLLQIPERFLGPRAVPLLWAKGFSKGVGTLLGVIHRLIRLTTGLAQGSSYRASIVLGVFQPLRSSLLPFAFLDGLRAILWRCLRDKG
jgi:hypothetical protein